MTVLQKQTEKLNLLRTSVFKNSQGTKQVLYHVCHLCDCQSWFVSISFIKICFRGILYILIFLDKMSII